MKEAKAMTHEELLKEMYEVCAFLEGKRKELETKYGDFPKFGDADDRWAFRLLETVCENNMLVREFDSISGYRKSVSEFEYHIGDGFRKAMETGQLNFE